MSRLDGSSSAELWFGGDLLWTFHRFPLPNLIPLVPASFPQHCYQFSVSNWKLGETCVQDPAMSLCLGHLIGFEHAHWKSQEKFGKKDRNLTCAKPPSSLRYIGNTPHLLECFLRLVDSWLEGYFYLFSM